MEEMKEVTVLLASKAKGVNFAKAALPVLVGISREVKEIEAGKENEAGPFKVILAGIAEKYKGALDVLGEADAKVRERVMNEYQDTETITGDEGELVFPCRWGYKVVDIKKVPPELLTVDGKAVNAEIKNGVRKIKGLSVETIRSLQVRAKKDAKD